MNRITQLFSESLHGRTAFMPFITAGDPDLAMTEQAILALDRAGCDLLELGFPYSDPIADGPVIQASYTRALANSIGVEPIMEMVRRLQPQINMPLIGMVSYSIIYRRGIDAFLQMAQAAGLAGLIVPDLPFEELAELAKLAESYQLAISPLVTPLTSKERAGQIAAATTGFVYYVSVLGVTGERSEFETNLGERVRQLRASSGKPVCIGFGISHPEHVERLAPFADGLIVGSAFVKRFADVDSLGRDRVIEEITRFAESLQQPLQALR